DPVARHVSHRFAPAYGSRDLLDQAAANFAGIRDRGGQHVDTSGETGCLMVTSASALAITSAAGCIRRQWNGADTGSNMARLAPLILAISSARSTAALSPETTTCPPPLSLAAWQTWPWAASAATAIAAS